jgi:hypothetical protein
LMVNRWSKTLIKCPTCFNFKMPWVGIYWVELGGGVIATYVKKVIQKKENTLVIRLL